MGKLKKRHVKLAVWARDNDICFYCGRTCTEEGNTDSARTVDHKNPTGGNGLDNLVTACRKCNLEKSNLPPAEGCIIMRAFEVKRIERGLSPN